MGENWSVIAVIFRHFYVSLDAICKKQFPRSNYGEVCGSKLILLIYDSGNVLRIHRKVSRP